MSGKNTPKLTYFLGFPAMPADQWDKDASAAFGLLEPVGRAINDGEKLVAGRSDGDDEPSRDGQLVLQNFGNRRCSSRHQDTVEWRRFGNTYGSVTHADVDVRDPKLDE